jgi:hypothetical protein
MKGFDTEYGRIAGAIIHQAADGLSPWRPALLRYLPASLSANNATVLA